MHLLNTLYVTVPESVLRLENNTVRMEVDRQARFTVPIHHLGGLVCFGNVALTVPLMHRLAEDGIALVLLDGNGRFKARLEGPTSGNVYLRQAQHKRSGDASFCLDFGRNCIAGKLKNSRSVLLRGAREAKSESDAAALARGADDLAASMRALPAAQSLEIIRGVEGDAARKYFACLGSLVRADARKAFAMDGRSRRPPRDPMNALLSFLYSMWMNDCRSAIEAAGLDPQVGFLHVIRPGRASLALDLMEEFRPFADRLALTLVNRGQLDGESFVRREGGAVSLTPDGRKAVLIAYQERKAEPISHPALEEAIPLGLVPLIQARLLARSIRGDADFYLPFVAK